MFRGYSRAIVWFLVGLMFASELVSSAKPTSSSSSDLRNRPATYKQQHTTRKVSKIYKNMSYAYVEAKVNEDSDDEYTEDNNMYSMSSSTRRTSAMLTAVTNPFVQPLNYCSFFNNRAPSPQANLKNCTWYKENSCCLQAEIESTFSKVINLNHFRERFSLNKLFVSRKLLF